MDLTNNLTSTPLALTSTSGQSANAGVGSSASATQLNKDFLTMLVTQIKHQDPMDPMDNSQMTAQLAQLSELSLLESIEQSMNKVTNSHKDRFAEAAALIDKTAIIPIANDDRIKFMLSDEAILDHIAINLRTKFPKEDVNLTFYNKNNEQVGQKKLTTNETGYLTIPFEIVNDLKLKQGEYSIETISKSGHVAKNIEAKIKSVTFDQGQEMQLDLAGISFVEASKVTAISQ